MTEAFAKNCPNRTKNSLIARITGEVPTNNAFELLNLDRSMTTSVAALHHLLKGKFHKALTLAAHVAGELDTIGREFVGGCSSFLNRVSVARS